MVGQFSKLRLGMLAALLLAATLPVMAEDAAKGSGGNCPTAAGLNGLRPALDECPAVLVLPKYGVPPLDPPAGAGTGQRTVWSTASDAGGEDQGAGHNTSAGSSRLARFFHHVTWSWAPTPPYADPFHISATPNRP